MARYCSVVLSDYNQTPFFSMKFKPKKFKQMLCAATMATGLWLGVVMPSAWAEETDYQLGRGYRVNDALTVGGYFSAEYEKAENEEKLVVDDLAILVYGHISSFSYLLELESVNFYVSDLEADSEEWNAAPAIERAYLDYNASDKFSIRFGKQITPIGYWNLQPINVLRDTTSNPSLTRRMFPKFLTGVDLHGYAPFGDDVTYHVYFQVTEDLDDEYINIPIDQHFGSSLEKRFASGWSVGGSVGGFEETTDISTQYAQLNAKRDFGKLRIQAEAIYASHDVTAKSKDNSAAAYLQSEYHFNPKHTIVSRVEYFRDQRTNERDVVGILGYSYRPQFPVSLKAEYQWHSDSADDQFVASFSVLF